MKSHRHRVYAFGCDGPDIPRHVEVAVTPTFHVEGDRVTFIPTGDRNHTHMVYVRPKGETADRRVGWLNRTHQPSVRVAIYYWLIHKGWAK